MHFRLLIDGSMMRAAPADPALKIPEHLAQLWNGSLVFNYLEYEQNGGVWDGSTRPGRGKVTSHRIPLYQVDEEGRFYCGTGFLSRIKEDLESLKFTYEITHSDSPISHLSADRFTADWTHLMTILRRNGEDLRYRQDEALAVMSTTERGLLEAPGGIGKGFLIRCYCLAHPRLRVHVIVDSTSVMWRLYDDLIRFYPDLGMVGDGEKKWGSRVTIISARSIQHAEFEDPSSRRFADVCLVDECHRVAAPDNYRKILRYRYARMLGLSATVRGRFDGADAALEAIFGRVVFSMTYAEAAQNGLVVPMQVEWLMATGPDIITSITRTDLIKKYGVWCNDARNKLIMDRMALVPPENQSLILVDTIEHLTELKRLDPNLTLIYAAGGLSPQDYGRYVAQGVLNPQRDPLITKQIMQRYRREFAAGTIKRAAANTVWDTGVDFTHLTTLVIAHANSGRIKSLQGTLRASRLNDGIGKTSGQVIDIFDDWNFNFRNKSIVRSRHYHSQGWQQIGLPESLQRLRESARV